MPQQFIHKLPFYLYGMIDGQQRVIYEIAHEINPDQDFVAIRVLQEWAYRARLRPVAPLAAYVVTTTDEIGDTITGAAPGAFGVADGLPVLVGDVLFLDDVATTSNVHNGLWYCDVVGDAFLPFVLRRCTTANQVGEITPGSIWYIEEGGTCADNYYHCNTTGTITPGVTAITFQPLVVGLVPLVTAGVAGIVNAMTANPGTILTGDGGATPGGVFQQGIAIDEVAGTVDITAPGTFTMSGNPDVDTGTGDTTLGGAVTLTDGQLRFAQAAAPVIDQEVAANDTNAVPTYLTGQTGGTIVAVPGMHGGAYHVTGGAGANGTGALAAGFGGSFYGIGGDAGTDGGGGGALGGNALLAGGQGSGGVAGGIAYVDGGGGPIHGNVRIGATNTTELYLGNAVDNTAITQVGVGQWTIHGNLDFHNASITAIGNPTWDLGTNTVDVDILRFGATPATGGSQRWTAGTTIYGRDVADAANALILSWAGDVISLGSNAAACDGVQVICRAGAPITIDGTGVSLTVQGSSVTVTGGVATDHTNTAAHPYAVVATDRTIIVDTTADTEIDLLPIANFAGQYLTIKDGTGNAVAKPVDIAPNGGEIIEGAAAHWAINWARGAVTLYCEAGVGYHIISKY